MLKNKTKYTVRITSKNKLIDMPSDNKQIEERSICKGYMTVYLSLTLIVLLSLCLTMIEGVRSNAIILESEIACDVAMNSILAEYNRELMKQYNIFSIEDSYGGNNASLDNTEAHLMDYLNNNFSANHFLGAFLNYRDYLGIEVDGVRTDGVLYLTDDNGSVFMRRAYEAIKDDVGMTLLSEIQEIATSIEESGLETMNLQGRMESLETQVEEAQKDAAEEHSSDDSDEIVEVETNPVETGPAHTLVSQLSYGVSNMFIDDIRTLSTKSIDRSKLISSRMRSNDINSGNLALEELNSVENFVERMVFQEYLLRYMGQYKEECSDDALAYQIEYIIGGASSDKENLDIVLSRIFLIRFALAYICIQNDEEKKELADLLAYAIAIFTYTEELQEEYRELYLFAWAGTEAIYDMKSLLAGNRIEFIKSTDNWHTSVLLTPDDREYPGDDEGLSYTDYLRVFMTLMPQNQLVARAMDMVEADIRLTPGNSNFRMDACIDTILVSIDVQSTWGYNYNFKLKKKYK